MKALTLLIAFFLFQFAINAVRGAKEFGAEEEQKNHYKK